MDALRLPDALGEIWAYVGALNKYIDQTEPWVLARDKADTEKLASVMVHLAEGLRIISVMLTAFLPDTAARIQDILGAKDADVISWESVMEFSSKVCGLTVKQMPPLFPRLDVKKELDALESIAGKPQETKEEKDKPEGVVTYDDFKKVELRVGIVKQAETIEGSDKLLKLMVDTGGELRQIVSGIRKWYSAEQMIGKSVVVVTNLKPAKLFGVESRGMLLAAESGGELKLVTIDGALPAGATVS